MATCTHPQVSNTYNISELDVLLFRHRLAMLPPPVLEKNNHDKKREEKTQRKRQNTTTFRPTLSGVHTVHVKTIYIHANRQTDEPFTRYFCRLRPPPPIPPNVDSCSHHIDHTSWASRRLRAPLITAADIGPAISGTPSCFPWRVTLMLRT